MIETSEIPEIVQMPGLPGYRVSPLGEVYSVQSGRWQQIRARHRANSSGLQITLRSGGQIVRRTLGRVVLEAYSGPCPGDYVCVHINGDHEDCRLENLRWGRRSETIRNRRRGESHPQSKITAADVVAMRADYARGATVAELAKRFGLSYAGTRGVVRCETWRHVAAGGGGEGVAT